MALPKSGKLVRDRIPEIVSAAGSTPVIVVLSNEQDVRESLHLKLREEAQELREASGDSCLEEMADVYEVLLALAAACGKTIDQVVAAADHKRQERGGFDARLWMVSVASEPQ